MALISQHGCWAVRQSPGPERPSSNHVMVMVGLGVDAGWTGTWESSYLPFRMGIFLCFDNYYAVLVHQSYW